MSEDSGIVRAILITGGAGFIGSNLIGHLVGHYPNARIRILDSLSYSLGFGNLPSNIVQNPLVELVEGSVTDEGLVRRLIKDADTIIHLAVETARQEKFIDVQMKGTYTVVEAALKAKVARFIFQSSGDVYGITNSADIKETDAVRATNLYAATKLGAEALITAYYHTYGLPAVVIRPVSIYGPRQYPEWLISKFITLALDNKPLTIMGDGSALRDWIYVDDVCRAFIAIIDCRTDIRGEVFNIGTGVEYSVNDIARMILDNTGKPASFISYVDPRPGDFPRQITKATKARKVLGWKAQIGLQEGLKKTIQWYEANKERDISHRD